MEVKPDFQIHELKTDPENYNNIDHGLKTCTIRVNDRKFKEGDYIILRKTKYTGAEMNAHIVGDLKNVMPLVYTGRALMVKVSHIHSGKGIANFYVCISFKIIDRWPGTPDK